MLTGKQVRVRYTRDRIVPVYLDTNDPVWKETAERLLELFRGQENKSRGQMDLEWREVFGDDPSQLVHQGLAKLLEDRCEFEVQAGQPPEDVREAVFRRATEARARLDEKGLVQQFDRQVVLREVAAELGMTSESVDHALFADLKSEQQLVRFKDISADHLLERYNVSLAQAVLLRSISVEVAIRGEPSQRYRQLFRAIKFHRLVCEATQLASGYQLRLDGPMSLFSATQKYGLQLALFLPALLRCRDFELKADLRWGPERKPKTFTLTAGDGLISHLGEAGMFVPAELAMFVDLFRKKIEDWEIEEEAELFPLGDSVWVPDFRLKEKSSGRVLYLEVLGFWRRSGAEKHLDRLRQHAKEPFLLAVSDQLHMEDSQLEDLPGGIYRFRQMPLPTEVVRLAAEVLNNR